MKPEREDGASRPDTAGDRHLGAVLAGGLLVALALTRLYDYLLFHSLVEIFTIAVAWSIFFLAWNARRFLDNHYLLFLGIASLFVGALDTLHTLAYKGMGVFPGDQANLPTQLWIAGRYLQSLSFLAAPAFLRRRLKPGLAVGVYTALVLLLLLSIYSGQFPACYVAGGLTRFKVVSEYVIAAILSASLALLLRDRAQFDGTVLRYLAASIVLTMAAELSFTLYRNVYGGANVAGHLLRFVAFCFLYRAIIVTGFVRPFDLLFRNLSRSEEALRQSEERYREFIVNGSEGICRLELDVPFAVSGPEEEQVRQFVQHAYVAECNDAFARMHGFSKASEILSARYGAIPSYSAEDQADLLIAFVRCGCRSAEAEIRETLPDGTSQHIAASYSGVVENGALIRVWTVQRDVTERRRAAAERERLIAELQQAMAEVKTLTGLLPICANCKNIRDDKGYWTQVEAYLGERAGVSFSHGICPDCMRKLYPEYYPDGPASPAAESRSVADRTRDSEGRSGR